MKSHYGSYGLNEDDLSEIIQSELDKNSDILLGIDDPEVQEMVQIIKEAVAKAIAENNEAIEESVEESIKKREKEILDNLPRYR